MAEQYSIFLDKPQHVFCAAHFITYDGNVCEPIHGHNYRVQCRIEGPLDENQYVADFVAVQNWLSEILHDLDHHVLLPTSHPQIRVAADDEEVEVRFESRRWVFPRCESALLPMPNTTAELLARYLAQRLLAEFDEHDVRRPDMLQMAVDECDGQWGVYKLTTRPSKPG